ncbi:MAG: glycine cleavage system aminomethyltransferase GcvT [bacterium]|nr:glycine cleavage system protein T [Deltaproteobacteria bacterium]MCP4903625.1 glycine cleavage system aminomethyltransferase GcvT [bacterium]
MTEGRRTALHATHIRLGARMVSFADWHMPVQYSSIKEEHAAVRERAGLFDVSHMGQIQISGRRAIEASESLVTCHVATLGVDRARYGLMLNEEGGCIDDVMVTRIAEDALFLCVNASNVAPALEWIESKLADYGGLKIENRSCATSLIAFQGPAAAGVLARLTAAETPLPKRFRVARCEIAGVRVLASGTGYTGSPGFEIYATNTDATALFEGLLEEGASDGVLPAGLGARDTLRLEAALPLYGHELDATTSPFEANLDRFVKPLESGFVGSAALIERERESDPRRLVGFEMTGRGIARADYEIACDGVVIGRVTSGAPSPTLGKSIGLGYVPRSRSGVGQPLTILIRGREISAEVVETPFS